MPKIMKYPINLALIPYLLCAIGRLFPFFTSNELLVHRLLYSRNSTDHLKWCQYQRNISSLKFAWIFNGFLANSYRWSGSSAKSEG